MCLCVWRFLCACECVCCILSICMCVAQLPPTLFSAHSVFIFIALYSPPLGIFHSSPFGFSFASRIFYVGFLASHNDDQNLLHPLPHPFLSLFVQHSVCTSHIAIALHIATGTTNSRRSSSDSFCFCFFLSCSYFSSVIFAIQRFVQRSVAVTFFVHFISVILRCN